MSERGPIFPGVYTVGLEKTFFGKELAMGIIFSELSTVGV